jgi:hypothetical protein
MHRTSDRTLRLLQVLFTALVCFGLARPVAAAQPPQTSPAALRTLDELLPTLPRSDVTGKVVAADGQPVGGAEVFLYYARLEHGVRHRLVARSTSDDAGAFKFDKALVWEPATPGDEGAYVQRYHVLAKHPRHGIEFTTLLHGQSSENLTIRMFRAGTWTIILTDDDGKPIEGASVHLAGGQHAADLARQLAPEQQAFQLASDIGISSGLTDARGQVVLQAPPQSASFRVHKPGYARALAPGRMKLFPSANVSGRITYEDGTPAAGVGVCDRRPGSI